jgi:hypothetical protein
MNYPVFKECSTQQNQSTVLLIQFILGTLHHAGSLCIQRFGIWSPSAGIKEKTVHIQVSPLKWASLRHWTNDPDQLGRNPKKVDNMQNNIHIPCNMSSSEYLVTAQKLYQGSPDFTFSSVLIHSKAVLSRRPKIIHMWPWQFFQPTSKTSLFY